MDTNDFSRRRTEEKTSERNDGAKSPLAPNNDDESPLCHKPGVSNGTIWVRSTEEENSSVAKDVKVLVETVSAAREATDAIWHTPRMKQIIAAREKDMPKYWFCVAASVEDSEAAAWLTAEARMQHVPCWQVWDEKKLRYGQEGFMNSARILGCSKYLLLYFSKCAYKCLKMWIQIDIARRLGVPVLVVLDRLKSMPSTHPQSFVSIGEFAITMYGLQQHFEHDYDFITSNEIVCFQRRKPLRMGMLQLLLDASEFGPKFACRKAEVDMRRKLWPGCKALVESIQASGSTIKYDTFLSHVQCESQDAVACLAMMLTAKLKEKRGETISSGHSKTTPIDIKGSIWYDQTADFIDVEAMVRGVAESRTFLLYATKSYFFRPFCRLELECAILFKKRIVVVWESDVRHFGFKYFGEFADGVPDQVRESVLKGEAETMHRRRFLRDASIERITRQVISPRDFTKTQAHIVSNSE